MWNADQRLELVRTDGYRVRVDSAEMEPVSNTAALRGQHVLRVLTTERHSFHAGGCVLSLA